MDCPWRLTLKHSDPRFIIRKDDQGGAAMPGKSPGMTSWMASPISLHYL